MLKEVILSSVHTNNLPPELETEDEEKCSLNSEFSLKMMVIQLNELHQNQLFFTFAHPTHSQLKRFILQMGKGYSGSLKL